MQNGRSNAVLRGLCYLCGGPADDEQTDRELLRRFAADQNEEAFAALVRRHGPLVLGVCRRVLGHVQDAEDVFQATFLVLACKAASIRKHESLASWLYGVAHRQAMKLVAEAARCRGIDQLAEIPPQPDPAVEVETRELRQVLDEEVSRLPEKYRIPLLLCCLAGKTHEQAAREMGWPTGSMSRWLDRARTLLRERLARRGVVLTAASLAVLPSETAAAAGLTAAGQDSAIVRHEQVCHRGAEWNSGGDIGTRSVASHDNVQDKSGDGGVSGAGTARYRSGCDRLSRRRRSTGRGTGPKVTTHASSGHLAGAERGEGRREGRGHTTGRS
jgi:RNA polymerase sigma factor (sigma-70 family)